MDESIHVVANRAALQHADSGQPMRIQTCEEKSVPRIDGAEQPFRVRTREHHPGRTPRLQTGLCAYTDNLQGPEQQDHTFDGHDQISASD